MKPILEVIVILLDMYMYVIIAAVILSWLVAFNVVNTRNQIVAMIADFLYRITEPVFRPIRNFLPNLGGIDFSPLIVLLIIYLLRRWIWDYIYPLVP
jgi:YggT family protein